MNTANNLQEIEQLPLKDFSEKAYLNYSMYVILDRALPRLADGLKPVQRRILYAMSELGLSAANKHKKSARTVGDVLGKFHPHGDSACYEAMVLMAQPFAYRYPLIDGQGNWGSSDDPKSFAAMRYTEAKLTSYAEVLLGELGLGTTDWSPNFDGTLEEPVLLPARLPNILLNGTTGIAVGMATDIPPHNLREVVQTCLALLKNPEISLEKLCEYLLGPDFPTDAELITPKKELLEMYRSGIGSVRLRARWELEQEDIIITALPYQVSGGKIMEQIAAQIQAKRIPWLEDIRDESDHENPTRLVLILRSKKIEHNLLMLHLFATTDLERSYRININLIGLNGRPQVMGLRDLLLEWLKFRIYTVRRRLNHRLEQVLDRLHILDGLLISYLNIDEVINIIRYEDEPKITLMGRFGLSERQVDAILNLRLRYLAKLEEVKISREQKDLADEKSRLETLLNSEIKLKELIRKELTADAVHYGDARRSPLTERAPAVLLDETLPIQVDPVTVVLSAKGWIRAAKSHDVDPKTISYKAGDSFLNMVRINSSDTIILFDSTGRSYSLPAQGLPSIRSQGEPLTGRLAPPPGAEFIALLSGSLEQTYLVASDAGYGFLVKLQDLLAKNKAGKAILTLPQGAKALPPLAIASPTSDQLVALTNKGRLLAFSVEQLPKLTKGKGNQIIRIASTLAATRDELLISVAIIPIDDGINLLIEKQVFSLKSSDLQLYRGNMGQTGKLLPKNLQQAEALIKPK